ncbi:protein CHROMATIN REMODELING 20 isoform X2 [Punica granatum]|uniref:ATP-dependent helicase ATRX n=1 Tax=Punica granatum TaxID=22663 RepID=A0A6P8DPB0_PUNGR|nr:protein CHROMATIN REMODELING 20 isoform X2 [Punica granatum]
MEDKSNDQEEIQTLSSDSLIESDDDGSLSSEKAEENDDKLHPQEPLTDQEIEDLIAEYLDVESKAAEAQEALEKESLAKLESEVREELAQSLTGDELEKAVADEMDTYKEEWEAALDELETESAHLLEQLDGAGIELPSLFKWIESQAPNNCSTEAWKKRTHWVGSQVTGEVTESVAEAEKHLQIIRPLRRKHGRVLEEGASGFLQKKIASEESKEDIADNPTVDWSLLNKIFSEGGASESAASFGTKHWASVYLASTPQQAAEMGLKFPGVDEVEEIDDIDANLNDPFVADAIANEREMVLSEVQKGNFKKVKEEEDANLDRKLQLHLKRRRHKRRLKQGVKEESVVDLDTGNSDGRDIQNEDMRMEDASPVGPADITLSDLIETRGSKRMKEEDEDLNANNKRSHTVSVEDAAEAETVKDDANKLTDVSEDKTTMQVKGKFRCTACGEETEKVHPHPLLKVIVCISCKCLMEEKINVKDSECSECYCGWCGRSSELVNCKSCNQLFCTTCIERNLGEEFLSKVQTFGWQCCCCTPSVLKSLTLELDEAMRSEFAELSSSGSDSDTSDSGIDAETRSKKKHKRKIRRILDDAELGEETKRKIAIEKERQERLRSLQQQFSAKSTAVNSTISDWRALEGAGIDVLGDAIRGYIVNVVRERDEVAIRVPPSISAKLKTHQVTGIRFIWENIVQSIGKVKSGDKGLGCILAHTMGLGKTLQVIAFLYTAMRCVDLGLRTALIVTPVNVLHNWRHEFTKWAPSEFKPIRTFMLEDVSRERRVELLAKWRRKGGVFLISYTAFRNLSVGKNIKDRNVARDIISALQDGPDILVCDEAHIIKNTRADTTQALKLVKCQRRIALTGSPLQNNLMEYYCMVDFVREGFLGSSHEFRNRFQNPIENGQHTNSTSEDVKIMNQRSHILYEQLKGFVQRMDMSVVKKDLPPKTVFVIAVKLSPLQRKLYKKFLDVHGFTRGRVYSENIGKRSFFAGYQALAQIWNHPGILQLRKEDRDYVRREDAVENFLVDDSSSDENVDFNGINKEKPSATDNNGFFRKGWWNDLLREHDFKEIEYSGKMVLLLDILTMSTDVGDKALVFSQSIPTLDLIELYLSRLPRHGKRGKLWKKGKDWYRLDGRTESSERQKLVERFNDPSNKRVKCTLISTRAGSLGINLYAANRVIIVDGSWNPTYDLQAIYRAWRYGQKKPVFAYRLLAQGTMEEKIYKRQVTKEGLAARVVDRQQVHRTISKEEMLHLFEFGDDENPDMVPGMTFQIGNTLLKQRSSMESCSSDKLMERLLGKHHPRWISDYHEHETLLQENEEERLSKEEQDKAWEMYRKSLEWEEVQRVSLDESIPEKPASTNTAAPRTRETNGDNPFQTRNILRNRFTQRKCTNLAHLLTLRSQGTKIGCTTVCGECAQEISWENLNRDAKAVR